MPEFAYKIVSIIASTIISHSIDIELFSHSFIDSSCSSKHSIHLKYKIRNPKITVLIRKKGKLTFCGAKNIEDIFLAITIMKEKLSEINHEVFTKPLIIENIVVSVDIHTHINIESFLSNTKNSEYEPEIFPGVIFRNHEPKFVAIIFRSGKINLTGIKHIHEIEPSVELIGKLIKSLM